MSANLFSDGESSSMMAGLLYAMKKACDCPGCIALRDMSDKLISAASRKKSHKNKK